MFLKRNKVLGWVCFLFCSFTWVYGQERTDTLIFRALSYNVENLFDTAHDSLKNDQEFLPDAVRRWTHYRYRQKLDNIARVIVAVGGWNFPALVALCEVENDRVLHDLTRYSVLREAGYRYVMTCSDDERGIDVALLYQRQLFKLLACRAVRVPRPDKRSRPTRDMLHVSGLLLNGDTLDVLVCHFPSRSQGAKAAESYRMLAARTVKQVADSVCGVRRCPQLLVMGDLNDEPHNRSVQAGLEVKLPPDAEEPLSDCSLYHLLARQAAAHHRKGTYKYKGEWNWLDHIIVSGGLLRPDSSFRTDESQAHVSDLPFLQIVDERYGGMQPFRTYHGMKYLGGYSDHLPVWVDFRLAY